MAFKELLRNTVLRMDLLSTSPTLRVRKQPQYQTVCGGLLSLTIMCVFSYFLYLQFFSMINNLSISYTQGLADDLQNIQGIHDFQFAVSIQGVDIRTIQNKIKFYLWNWKYQTINGVTTNTNRSVLLQPCNKTTWSKYGTSFTKQANAFGFQGMLCIGSNQTTSLSGYVGAPLWQFLVLSVIKCNKTRIPSCDNSTVIDSYLGMKDFFSLKLYVLDTIITPTNPNPITQVLQKNIFLSFSKTLASQGFINIGQYTLEDDISYLPTQKKILTTGSYIQKFATNTVSTNGNNFVGLSIYKSTKALTISRKMGKIDQVLSYVGGLFGLIFTGIAFLVGSYSEMKYQIYIAQSILRVDQSGKRVRQSQFGFTTYVFYAIYDWLDTFGIAPSCLKSLKDIHEVREQACEVLDPIVILKRIKYLEQVSKVLLSQHKQLCLHLIQPMTVNQSIKFRKTLMYYDDLMRKMQAIQNEGNFNNPNKVTNQYNDKQKNQQVTPVPLKIHAQIVSMNQQQNVGNKIIENIFNPIEKYEINNNNEINQKQQLKSMDEQSEQNQKIMVNKITLALSNIQKQEGEVASKIKQRISRMSRLSSRDSFQLIRGIMDMTKQNDKQKQIIKQKSEQVSSNKQQHNLGNKPIIEVEDIQSQFSDMQESCIQLNNLKITKS